MVLSTLTFLRSAEEWKKRMLQDSVNLLEGNCRTRHWALGTTCYMRACGTARWVTDCMLVPSHLLGKPSSILPKRLLCRITLWLATSNEMWRTHCAGSATAIARCSQCRPFKEILLPWQEKLKELSRSLDVDRVVALRVQWDNGTRRHLTSWNSCRRRTRADATIFATS